MKKDKNILIIANCTWYLYNFRKELLDELNNEGYKLILLSTIDKYSHYLEKYFLKVNKLFLVRGSENLFLEFFTLINIFYCHLKYRPTLVHNFTIKPSIYGGMVGRFLGTRVVLNHITGLGPSFFSNRKKIDILNKILEPFYKYAFNNKNSITIFHNKEDRDTFIKRKITSKEKTKIIKGSGVDTDFFIQPRLKKRFNKNIQVLFPARILKEKGILELISACKELWENNYQFTLNVAGHIDRQNKSCLSENYLKILNNKNIKFLGKSDNMLEIYKKIDIVVLPSWREGLSKSLLEASSMSIPIITTDVPGCRDIIRQRFSGLLVPPKNKESLKNAIKYFLDNQDLSLNYGRKARDNVVKKYTTKVINKKILEVYKASLSKYK